jgi:carboxymethylenebutenolidase
MSQLDDSRSDFDSLRPGDSTEQGATRRTALKAAIGVGYAAAVMPVMAQTAISTSTEGLKAGPIKYTVNGFEVPAYAPRPPARPACR